MSEREFDEHQNSLFEDYQRRLSEDPAAEPHRDLDPGLAEVARQLEADMGGPNPDQNVAPDPAFVASLRQRIVAEAERLDNRQRPAYGAGVNGRVQNMPRKRREQRLPTGKTARTRSVYWGALAAGLAALLVVGALLWTREPNEVSAHEIVQRAQTNVESPDLAGIESFRLTEVTTTSFSFDGPLRIERTHWFHAPDQWRIEIEETIGSGDDSRVVSYGTVSTGDEVWLVDENGAERAEPPQNPADVVENMRFGGGLGNLDLDLIAESDCYAPAIRDDEGTIAGRAAYVIDLGPSQCPSASMPETNGRRVIWVDKDTYFILKAVLYDGTPGQEDEVVSESVVTAIDYNTELAASLFTPPATETADASQPTATPAPPPTTLEGFREIADYQIFVPTHLPAGFASADLEDAGGANGSPQVSVTYRDASGDRWLSVLNGQVGCCLSYKAGTSVTLPNGLAAHFVSGQPDGGAGILWWEQDGAYVSIDSTHADLSHAELLEIANSMSGSAPLEPVPSADATEPSTTTTAPPAGEVDVLYPAWLPQPSTITEEQRPDGRGGEFTMLLIDHNPDDDANDVLRLSEYPLAAAPEPAVDPQSTVEQIDGREVTVIHRGDACTAMSWRQDGLALSLTNAYDPPGEILYSCDQMRQIVASIEPGASPPTN